MKETERRKNSKNEKRKMVFCSNRTACQGEYCTDSKKQENRTKLERKTRKNEKAGENKIERTKDSLFLSCHSVFTL